MEDDEKFGFIIMDGNGSLYGNTSQYRNDLMKCVIGTLQGNNRDVLHKFSVTYPRSKSMSYSLISEFWAIGMVVEVSLLSDLHVSAWRNVITMSEK